MQHSDCTDTSAYYRLARVGQYSNAVKCSQGKSSITYYNKFGNRTDCTSNSDIWDWRPKFEHLSFSASYWNQRRFWWYFWLIAILPLCHTINSFLLIISSHNQLFILHFSFIWKCVCVNKIICGANSVSFITMGPLCVWCDISNKYILSLLLSCC